VCAQTAEVPLKLSRPRPGQPPAGEADAGDEQAGRLGPTRDVDVRHVLEEQLRGGLDERALHAARERGGRGFADGLEVEPAFRPAVEAVLGEILSGLVLDADAARSLAELPGVIVLRDGRDGRPRATGPRLASRSASCGQGRLAATGSGTVGWAGGSLGTLRVGARSETARRCASSCRRLARRSNRRRGR
jgi:hypothetical protein